MKILLYVRVPYFQIDEMTKTYCTISKQTKRRCRRQRDEEKVKEEGEGNVIYVEIFPQTPLSYDLALADVAEKRISLIKIARNPCVKGSKTHKVEKISPWNFYTAGIQARFDKIFGSSAQYRIDADRT